MNRSMFLLVLFLCLNAALSGSESSCSKIGDDSFLEIFAQWVSDGGLKIGDLGGESLADKLLQKLVESPSNDLNVKGRSIPCLIKAYAATKHGYVEFIPNVAWNRRKKVCAIEVRAFREDGSGTEFWLVAAKDDREWVLKGVEWVMTWDTRDSFGLPDESGESEAEEPKH